MVELLHGFDAQVGIQLSHADEKQLMPAILAPSAVALNATRYRQK